MKKFIGIIRDRLTGWLDAVTIEAENYNQAVEMFDAMCDRDTRSLGTARFETVEIERARDASKRIA